MLFYLKNKPLSLQRQFWHLQRLIGSWERGFLDEGTFEYLIRLYKIEGVASYLSCGGHDKKGERVKCGGYLIVHLNRKRQEQLEAAIPQSWQKEKKRHKKSKSFNLAFKCPVVYQDGRFLMSIYFKTGDLPRIIRWIHRTFKAAYKQ